MDTRVTQRSGNEAKTWKQHVDHETTRRSELMQRLIQCKDLNIRLFRRLDNLNRVSNTRRGATNAEPILSSNVIPLENIPLFFGIAVAKEKFKR